MDPSESLSEAVRLARGGELASALAGLLAAWRAHRHPRIADLIDRVSERVTSAAPIPGKTVGQRDDAWRALARRKEPAELSRLLRTLWPKQWRDGRPLLDLLDRWPDDPRLAMFLARTLEMPPYDSKASAAFYELVPQTLSRLSDVRTLPVLQAIVARAGFHYAVTAASGAEASLNTRFPRGAPALPPTVEDALRQAEALFAPEFASASASREREAELLAAIYEHPHDDAARAVYGDWLVERGDPRGELIALQLAKARGEPIPAARETELLKAHARAWMHPLGELFKPDTRVFDRGFFGGGALTYHARIADSIHEPAWRLISEVACWDERARELVDRPELVGLRSLQVPGDVASEVAMGGVRRLTSLRFDCGGLAGDRLEGLATCAALPELRTLEVSCNDPADARWLAAAPVVDRIERLEVLAGAHFHELAATLATRRSALRELVLAFGYTLPQWRATLRRETADGPFTSATVTYGRWPYASVVESLVSLLDHLPATLRRLVIEPGFELGPAARELLEPVLARFAGAELEIPWRKPAQPIVEDGQLFEIRLRGPALLDPDLVKPLWLLLAALGQKYDSCVVGYGSAVQALGADPVARLSKLAANQRTTKLVIQRSDGRDRATIGADKQRFRLPGEKPMENFSDLAIVLRDRTADELAAWFVRLVELAPFTSGSCHPARPDGQPRGCSWLTLWPRETELDKLRAIDGLVFVDTAYGIVMRAAASPSELTDERMQRIDAAIRELHR